MRRGPARGLRAGARRRGPRYAVDHARRARSRGARCRAAACSALQRLAIVDQVEQRARAAPRRRPAARSARRRPTARPGSGRRRAPGRSRRSPLPGSRGRTARSAPGRRRSRPRAMTSSSSAAVEPPEPLDRPAQRRPAAARPPAAPARAARGAIAAERATFLASSQSRPAARIARAAASRPARLQVEPVVDHARSRQPAPGGGEVGEERLGRRHHGGGRRQPGAHAVGVGRPARRQLLARGTPTTRCGRRNAPPATTGARNPAAASRKPLQWTMSGSNARASPSSRCRGACASGPARSCHSSSSPGTTSTRPGTAIASARWAALGAGPDRPTSITSTPASLRPRASSRRRSRRRRPRRWSSAPRRGVMRGPALELAPSGSGRASCSSLRSAKVVEVVVDRALPGRVVRQAPEAAVVGRAGIGEQGHRVVGPHAGVAQPVAPRVDQARRRPAASRAGWPARTARAAWPRSAGRPAPRWSSLQFLASSSRPSWVRLSTPASIETQPARPSSSSMSGFHRSIRVCTPNFSPRPTSPSSSGRLGRKISSMK